MRKITNNRCIGEGSLVGRLFFLLLFTAFPLSPLPAQDICARLEAAWKNVDSYRCTYRAVTRYEGKQTESVMTYTFAKPCKVRMDIQKPKEGAVLIYNPDASPKVRVRPFPSLPFFVLKYNLTDPTVCSGSGGTIERSHIGERIAALCKEISSDPHIKVEEKDGGKRIELSRKEPFLRKAVHLGESGLISRIEVYDAAGRVAETFEFGGLEVNPKLGGETFTKFQ